MNYKSFGWVKVLYIILAIVYILAGITFFTNPITSEYVLGMFIGSLLIVYGVMCIVNYFMSVNFKSIWTLLLGLALIVLGLIVDTNLFDSMNFLGIAVGFGFLFAGCYKIYQSIQFKDLQLKGWWMVLILGICTLAVGCIMVFNPSTSGSYLTILIGTSLLVNGVSDLMLGIMAF